MKGSSGELATARPSRPSGITVATLLRAMASGAAGGGDRSGSAAGSDPVAGRTAAGGPAPIGFVAAVPADHPDAWWRNRPIYKSFRIYVQLNEDEEPEPRVVTVNQTWHWLRVCLADWHEIMLDDFFLESDAGERLNDDDLIEERFDERVVYMKLEPNTDSDSDSDSVAP